ncbi:MAG: DUF2080 family transposase-associated protein [Methanosarcinales archaeon]|nr:DUF2080 family transposase-associated protein [Methanosarcinales archaeon]
MIPISMESNKLLDGELPKTPKRPPKPILKTTFNTEGLEVIRRKVNKSGSGAHVTIPKEWLDETVVIIRTGEK